MISCTEFIPVYSELFKFLHAEGGGKAVTAFWEGLSDAFLGNFRYLVERKGLAGCFEYWSGALTEEAADFRMTLDEEKGILTIDMRRCPSKGRLLETGHLEPYPDYCRHCAVLYRRVLEPLGYKHSIDLSECDKAKCSSVIRRAPRR